MLVSKKFLALFAVLTLSSTAALAQIPSSVDPGRINNDLNKQNNIPQVSAPAELTSTADVQAPAGSDKITLVLRGVDVTGAQKISADRLAVTYKHLIGKKITLTQVYGIANAMTRLYRDAGYLLSRAVVPQQEIGNGAMYNPGTPTILDARTVDFDGFVANSFTLPFGHPLEDKLFDFDDTGALGQIFTVSLNGLDSNQLLPEQFLRGLRGRGGGTVTITGLPFASLRGNALSPLDLANIAPAAGGNRTASAEDLNNIETAAGGGLSPEQLNDIDTASGSQNVACWGGVTNVSAPVTYSLSEDPGAMMTDAANCAQSGSSL